MNYASECLVHTSLLFSFIAFHVAPIVWYVYILRLIILHPPLLHFALFLLSNSTDMIYVYNFEYIT